MSTDGWTDKENVVYTYNRLLFILAKEGNSAIGYNLGEFGRHYVKWNKSDIKKQILYYSTYIRNLK